MQPQVFIHKTSVAPGAAPAPGGPGTYATVSVAVAGECEATNDHSLLDSGANVTLSSL